ncbi:unnamed protein product [Boreogadus saida]
MKSALCERGLRTLPAVQLPEYTAEAAGLTPKLRLRPDGFNGGQTAAEASAAVQWGFSAEASVRQLLLGELGGSPPENGIVLPELSCQAAAKFPPPELLVP